VVLAKRSTVSILGDGSVVASGSVGTPSSHWKRLDFRSVLLSLGEVLLMLTASSLELLLSRNPKAGDSSWISCSLMSHAVGGCLLKTSGLSIFTVPRAVPKV